MPTTTLTDRSLRSLTVAVRTEYWDEVLSGFGVRVSPKGDKTFFVMYWHLGQRRRLTLGKFPAMTIAQARKLAKAKQGELADGRDPARGDRRGENVYSVAELIDDYLEQYAKPFKRSWQEDERLLKSELLPACGGKRAKDVRKQDLREILERIVERGHGIAANRTRAVIRKVFAWAVEKDLVEVNPCASIPRLAPERRRERVLAPQEISALWRILEQEHDVTRDAMRLLLLTAQRRNEVRSVTAAQIEDGLWTIPASLTKNKRSHVVPLSEQARRILEPWQRGAAGHLLLSPRIPGSPLSEDALTRAAKRISRKLGFSFIPHDLRRTAATYMTRIGVLRFVVSRVLNHTDQSVTGVYDLYEYVAEKRDALQRWADHLDTLVSLGAAETASASAA